MHFEVIRFKGKTNKNFLREKQKKRKVKEKQKENYFNLQKLHIKAKAEYPQKDYVGRVV